MAHSPSCLRCGEPHAPFGLGTPLVKEREHYCGKCIVFQPASQATLALKARDALEDREITVR